MAEVDGDQPAVTQPAAYEPCTDESVQVVAQPSGFVKWGYTVAGFDMESYVAFQLRAANYLTHWIVFRGGWTIIIRRGQGRARRLRYPNKRAALADLDRQRALAGARRNP